MVPVHILPTTLVDFSCKLINSSLQDNQVTDNVNALTS